MIGKMLIAVVGLLCVAFREAWSQRFEQQLAQIHEQVVPAYTRQNLTTPQGGADVPKPMDALDEAKVGIAAEFIAISPGKFEMGNPLDEADRHKDETPHSVTLTAEASGVAAALDQLKGIAPQSAAPIPSVQAGKTVALPVEIFPRSTLPKAVLDRVAEARAKIAADQEDPSVERFAIPKTQAYVRKIMAQLVAASGLEGRMEPVYLYVNTDSWGEHDSGLNSGTLKVEPESVSAMSSEDEVAAVIAHELGHHLRAHSERLAAILLRHPRRGGGDIFTPSRPSRQEIQARLNDEIEADAISVILLANAGYDPAAAIDALRSIRYVIDHDRRFEFYRRRFDPFHPSIDDRAAHIRQVMEKLGISASRRTSEGLPEVYEELAGRHRPSDPQTTARLLFEHYSWPKTFAR